MGTEYPFPARRGTVVGEHRHGRARVAAEEHGAGDGRAAEPLADVVEGGVERAAAWRVERQRELDGVVVVEVGDGDADEREALAARSWAARGASSPADRRRGSCRCARWPSQGVRAGGPGEVVEAQAQHDGAADPAGGAHPAGHPVDETRRAMASMSRGERGCRPSARCDPIERRRRPTATGRGSRLWASAWRWRPDAGPSIATSAASPQARRPRRRS